MKSRDRLTHAMLGTGVGTRLRRVAIVVALSFLVFAFARARERRLSEQARLGERARDYAATAAQSLDATILQAHTLLQAVAYLVDPAAPPERNDALLASLADRIPTAFSNLNVVDTLGRNIGAARLPPGGRPDADISDREYFRTAMRTRAFTVGIPVQSRTRADGSWVLPFMLPITDGTSDRVLAVAGGSILLDSLEAVRTTQLLPPRSVLTVIDTSGIVAIRTIDADLWIGRPFPGYERQGNAAQSLRNDTAVLNNIDPVDRLFGAERLQRLPWRVFVGIPEAEAFAPSTRQFALDVLIGLLIGVGIVLVGYWLTERFVAPIAWLTEDAQAISAGDMTRRSAIATNDEVGMLARAFNQMADDIVERTARLEESQAHLYQAQKLEALGTFAGGIAHDFNNYLSSIMGHAELALLQLSPPSRLSEARLELESLLNASARAADLTRQILVFSRHQVVTPVAFDANHALRGMQRLLERVVGVEVALRLELAPGLGSIRLDVGQFEQAMMNLAINASDAMGGRGRFVLRTSRRELANGTFVCLEAEDTGPGITPEVQTRIFEPFFTTKGRAKGTGLGLSIIYSIVSGAGGSIFVDNSYTAGARFVLLFPEGVPVQPQDPLGDADAPAGHQERILVVDDDRGVSLVTERLLRSNGYQVECVADATQALQMLERSSFDLLITDIVMPGMKGPELVRAIAARHGMMPTLFVSGYPDDDMRGELSRGSTRFLAKPFSRQQLLRAVRDLLDQSFTRQG